VTLFGNRDALGLELQPLSPNWERRYAAEQTAWAALRIWIGGVNLCDHVAEGSNQLQDAVNVPLAPLADWLVRSWAHLRFEELPRLYAASDAPHENLRLWGEAPPVAGLDEEPWLESRERWWSNHFVLAGAEGSFLPNLALARSHDRLICEWAPARTVLPGAPGWIREGGLRAVDWAVAEEGVAEFAAFIAEWLRNERLETLYPWAPLADPIRETHADAKLELELLTGHSIDELAGLLGARTGEELQRSLGLTPAGDPSASPVTQALRDLPLHLDRSMEPPLAWLRDQSAEGAPPGLRRVRAAALDAARTTASDTEAGYEAATAVRRELGLNGGPLPDAMDLCTQLGIRCREFEGALDDGHMVAGGREGRGMAAAVLRNDRTQADWVRRFEWARALGHIVLDSYRAGAMGAASSSRCVGYRRRRSAAFAAELLLPRDALSEITGGVLDVGAGIDIFEDLMHRFGTGATTTAQHLFNRHFLSSRAVRDDLIERHAARP